MPKNGQDSVGKAISCFLRCACRMLRIAAKPVETLPLTGKVHHDGATILSHLWIGDVLSHQGQFSKPTALIVADLQDITQPCACQGNAVPGVKFGCKFVLLGLVFAPSWYGFSSVCTCLVQFPCPQLKLWQPWFVEWCTQWRLIHS